MILHVDMDAFYASVEERDRPELAGKPLIVGGTPEGRGVVAAANYAVRKFGVHSAMPTSTALKRCPQAIVLRPRMAHYAEISTSIREIFSRYTPLVEPLSLDEAFLDVTGSEGLFGPAVDIAVQIKRDIQQTLRLVASVGVAPNKFLAKIASDLDKPDGLVVVEADRIQEFLAPLPVGRLWGVGRVTNRTLDQLGIATIGQLGQLPVEELRRHFGQSGEHLWQLANGIDNRAVVPDRDAKSISHETTFPADIDDADVLRSWLLDLTEQVARRLRQHKLRGRIVQIKLRFADFRTIVRSKTLPQATHSTDTLWETAADLLTTNLQPQQPLRLLGIGVSALESAQQTQQLLFDDSEAPTELDNVADSIRERFGSGALKRGSSIERGNGGRDGE